MFNPLIDVNPPTQPLETPDVVDPAADEMIRESITSSLFRPALLNSA
jgi:hypothetical protein